MKNTMIRQGLAIALILIICRVSWAERHLLSEFQLQVASSISNGNSPLLVDEYSGKRTIKLDNFSVEAKYPTWLEDVVVNIDYKFSPLNPWNFDQAQDLKTETFSATVNIGTIKTIFTETQETGGTVITFDFRAQCKNVPLTLTDPATTFTAEVTPKNMGSKIQLTLNKSKLMWPENAWTVGDMKCSGVEGFSTLAKPEITKILQNPSNIEDKIFAYLKKEVKRWERDINKTLFKKNRVKDDVKNFMTYFYPQNLVRESDQNFTFGGHFHSHFKNIDLKKKNRQLVSFKSQPPHMEYAKGATLALPNDALEEIIRGMLKNGNFFEKFTSNKVSGWKDFMRSESNRSYVWPDLLNYNDRHVFKFEMFMVEDPEVTRIQNYNGEVVASIRSRVAAIMYAPKNGKYVPYVEWTSPIHTNFHVSITERGHLRGRVGNGSYRWRAKMLPKYIKEYNVRNTSIDAETIGPYIEDGFKDKNHHWELPPWQLNRRAQFRASKVETRNDYFLIFLDLHAVKDL